MTENICAQTTVDELDDYSRWQDLLSAGGTAVMSQSATDNAGRLSLCDDLEFSDSADDSVRLL